MHTNSLSVIFCALTGCCSIGVAHAQTAGDGAAAPAIAPAQTEAEVEVAASPAIAPVAPVAPITPVTSVTIATGSVKLEPTNPFAYAKWFISLDRLTSVGGWSISHTEPNQLEVTESGTVAALVGGGVSTGATVPLNPYAAPRLSLDVRVSRHATLGLGLVGIVTTNDIDMERGNASASQEGEQRWLVAVTPRLGYLLPVTNFLTLWGRTGCTLSEQRTYDPNQSVRASLGSVDVEGLALFRIGSTFAISTALALSLPFYGLYTVNVEPPRAAALGVPTDWERDFSMTSFIAQLGVVAVF